MRSLLLICLALMLTACAQTPTGTRDKPKSTGTLHLDMSYETVLFNLRTVAESCIVDNNASRTELSFEVREPGKASTVTTELTSLYGTQILSVLDITEAAAGTDIRYFQGDFSWHNREFIDLWVHGEMQGCKVPVAVSAPPPNADALSPVNLIIHPNQPIERGTALETSAIVNRIIQSGTFSKVALLDAKYPISLIIAYREEDPPETTAESAQSWAGALTAGVIPFPVRKIYILDVALVFDGTLERTLSYQEEVTMQQGMLTGDVRKKQQAIAEKLAQRFLDDVKREDLLP